MTHSMVVEPIMRPSGLISIEVIIENNKITDAICTENMFRGFENLLRGKNPLDAVFFTERVCGIYSMAHSLAASLTVEDALDLKVDFNSTIMRNLIHGCEFLQKHIRHFYTCIMPDYIKGLPISQSYNQGFTDYRVPYSINKRLSDHYAEGMKYSSMAYRMLAVLGENTQWNRGIYIGGSKVEIHVSQYVEISSMLRNIEDFIKNVMLEDVETIAKYYEDYFQKGGTGLYFLSFGLFDEFNKGKTFYINPSVIIDGRWGSFNEDQISKNLYLSCCEQNCDNEEKERKGCVLHPNAMAAGGGKIFDYISRDNIYSVVSAARYGGEAMEVGPLARMYLSGIYTRGNSTMDRIVARVLECHKVAGIMEEMLLMMEFVPFEQKIYEIPEKASGRALKDTAEGALGHWLSIDRQRIDSYEIITPGSWNFGPQGRNHRKGVIEKALIGTKIENELFPVEVGRIIRSFDPCVSCVTHIITSKNESEFQII